MRDHFGKIKENMELVMLPPHGISVDGLGRSNRKKE